LVSQKQHELFDLDEILLRTLFEPNSVDFLMSYFSLHWLDTSSRVTDIAEWKLGLGDSNKRHLTKFVSVNEKSAPASLRESWRVELANPHLANFLAFRARELRPGAEMMLMMVASPHDFMTPPNKDCGPLTLAMQRCIREGSLREQVLAGTTIPYFLRNVEDIQAAVDLASTLSEEGALLEVVDVREYEAITGGGSDTLDGACNLFWAIHGGSVESAGATEKELVVIRARLREVFDEFYDPRAGVRGTFLACVLRRRTRKPWGRS
jgi:hypothetical protein